jgi:hypothetical protein
MGAESAPALDDPPGGDRWLEAPDNLSLRARTRCSAKDGGPSRDDGGTDRLDVVGDLLQEHPRFQVVVIGVRSEKERLRREFR